MRLSAVNTIFECLERIKVGQRIDLTAIPPIVLNYSVQAIAPLKDKLHLSRISVVQVVEYKACCHQCCGQTQVISGEIGVVKVRLRKHSNQVSG